MLHARSHALRAAQLVAMTTLAWSSQASAQEEAPAAYTRLIQSAAKKYNAKDYAGAISDFEKAYSVYPEPDVIYNIARVYEKMGNFQKAVAHYDQFVNLPDIELAARQDALARGKALREVLELREPKPPAPVEPPVAKLEPTPAAPAPKEVSRVPEIALGVASASALVAGGVFALLTSSANESFEDAQTLEQRRDAADQGRAYALTSDVLWVSGAALGLAGVITYVIRTPDDTPVARVRPMLSPTQAGATLHMRF